MVHMPQARLLKRALDYSWRKIANALILELAHESDGFTIGGKTGNRNVQKRRHAPDSYACEAPHAFRFARGYCPLVLMFILNGGGGLAELFILIAAPLACGSTIWLIAWIVKGFMTSSGHE